MLDEATVVRLAAPIAGEGGVLAVAPEGAGWDHQAWRVDTAGGPWIVRAATAGTPAERAREVRREVAAMQLVRRHLGRWVADAVVIDERSGCLAHRRIPGVPLQDLLAAGAISAAATTSIATQVGALIRAIGELDPTGADIERDEVGLAAWVDELPQHVAAVEHLLTPSRRAAIERFRTTPPPPDPDLLVLQHNDLGAEHVLVDDGAISGIIDWSDVAIADPAADVGRLLRDLGETRLAAVLDGYGATGDERAALVERAWCYARCLIVEDLAYAVEHRPDLVELELANLDRLYETVR